MMITRQQHSIKQIERETHAQQMLGTVHARFYPPDAVEYEPESPLAELGVFLCQNCPRPETTVSFKAIHQETASFYTRYQFARHIELLRTLNQVIRTRLALREPYAFVFAHLLLYSRISCSSPEVDRDAVFLCARHLRDLYTHFVRCLVDFDICHGILDKKLRALLLLYLSTLSTVYSNQLPIW